MKKFRWDYAAMAALAVVQVATNFSSPVAINRLLDFIETKGSGATFRPGFWIFLLFAGPTIGSLATQWSKFTYNRLSIQTEAILTELLFEHSLQIRVKSEVSEQRQATDDAAKSRRNFVGKINNLATVDLQNIINAGETFPLFIIYLLQSCLGVWFLYAVLGWAAFVGLGVTIAVFPLPGYIGRRIRFVQEGLMQRTDARVQRVSETMGVLRMIKLFAWERITEQQISEVRHEELKWLWKAKALQLSIAVANKFFLTIPTVVMKQELNASKVFSSMTVFDMFRAQLHEFFATLTSTELLESKPTTRAANFNIDDIGFGNATFSWSMNDTTNDRRFIVRIDDHLVFKKNCINLIVGPTGSGKTSILMALLGEMHFIPTSRDSWFNLPRDAGVAYAAQQSWVQNATIRANIVFGSPFDSERYNKVIYQCGLEQDLSMFEAGDLQEIGEGGATLSGGQRMRVTLARAVYSKASILLLDDVLAALDVHTASRIVEKCLAGDLLANRTTLLVTHNIPLVQPIAGFVISLSSDGRVLTRGSVSEVLAQNQDLTSELEIETKASLSQDQGIDDNKLSDDSASGGKLIVAEGVNIGHVSWAARKYLSFSTWYLGYFASQYDNHDKGEVDVGYHLTVYGGILLATLVIYSCSYIAYLLGMVRASKIIHTRLIQSVLGTTLRFLDITPTSRVIARCTHDLSDVDANIGQTLWAVVDLFIFAGIRLAAIVLLAPPFLLPALVLLVVGAAIGRRYTRAQLSVKREMFARAPILGHFGSTINGIVSIRAYGAQEAFIDVSLKHINRYTRTAWTFHNLSRWVALRMDFLGTTFITILAIYMVYVQEQDSSATGFSLNMASSFGMIILFGVSTINQLEIESSLERIENYLQIEQEPKASVNGRPPAQWPSSGNLRATNLSARYSKDGPMVLRSLSFDIKSGERIGIVGRTGSGKSSLTLALLRGILTEGSIYYDFIPTSSLNLEALRQNITIIPQNPELLNGSLRMNLDPSGEHDDATLNAALEASGLLALQGGQSDENGRITLDTMLASGGGDLSQGQRQILALSRALIRRTKLLILDEDYETDQIIQQSLRTELNKDTTLLVVAHRLRSVIDADRINTHYRVFRGILAARSSVFEDMQTFPQPPASEQDENCAFLLLPDPAPEVTVFLKAIFDADFFKPYPAPAEFNEIIGCLRLGHKYGVDFLWRRALVHLSSGYATTLSRLDAMIESEFGEESASRPSVLEARSWTAPLQPAHQIRAIQAAREVGALWILPRAFYILCSDFQALHRAVLIGTDYEGIPTSLSEHDQEVFIKGREIQSGSSADILQFLSHPLNIKTHQAARQEFWDKLPEMYDLPNWNELERLKMESIGAALSPIYSSN
ncbi:P-loop containing nucleoside triphosphate hydrolase protein [Favolaschia claudopus]|uniref:P-loop containing nucleoside triphosphate hydrolase protein n=1 Tax=Favolaschia claudopus TaxID=2862362 RepID=A0AAW0C8Z5_9AGAR